MKLNHYRSRTILLAMGAILIVWIDPIGFGVGLAQTSLIPAPSLQSEQPAELVTSDIDTLPPAVKTAVINDAVQRTSKTVSAMKILEVVPQEWSDGCLGLGKPEEICTQVITPGYQVVVTDGLKNWTYRTDDVGNLIRLEN